MKKLFVAFMILVFILSFVGCSNVNKNQENNQNQGVDQDQKFTVYTSFYVLADFAKKIGGDHVEVTNVIPPGVEPHDFELTPKQIAQLNQADLFVYNGGGFEPWLGNLVDDIKEKVEVVDSTKQIEFLTTEDEHTDEQEQKNEHGKGLDPHVWLNPINAISQAEQIKEALVKIDSDHQAEYEDNFQQLKQALLDLDQAYQHTLEKAHSKDIFVSHAAFGYLAERYGLNQVSIAGLSTSDEPSPKEMANIIKKAKELNIKYILFEPLVESKYAKTIMAEIGAQRLELNPLEGLTKDELERGEDYLSIMKKNLEVLKIALGVK
ncbi:metal ABC transporter substrate-binding protein [Tepidibacillus sp. HK-1]|uniref:metal ABC transporter substrate-binding protein n=1 Tax=Tepidibacillus sp. HK-1 TaxID=1883407 RepID=UPI000853363D|nr:metal ABC transporter substrate-binding protein [Tepidibacillus sp. HK-1]GBF10277.1 high-affinity zinc uptake system binding-protein ZnuA precursor [Tepidibacillus sp. HK-1]